MNITREYRFTSAAMGILLALLGVIPFAVPLTESPTAVGSCSTYLPQCFIKDHTGAPCPSCGLTRSVVAFYHGRWELSRSYHPLGWLFAPIVCAELLGRLFVFRSRSALVPWIDLGHFGLLGATARLTFFG